MDGWTAVRNCGCTFHPKGHLYHPKATAMMFKSLVLATALTSGVSAFMAPKVAFTSSPSALQAERQPIMAGNWKMNPLTEEEAYELANGLTSLLGEETCPIDEDNDMCTEVVIFPPHPFISKV